MTKREAERRLLEYREIDNAGSEHGFRIVKYLGEQNSEHYFVCVASDVENPRMRDYLEYAVLANGDIFCVPIN